MPRPASWVSDLALRIASEVPRLLSSWMATNVSRASAGEAGDGEPGDRAGDRGLVARAACAAGPRMTPSRVLAGRGETNARQELGQIALLQQGPSRRRRRSRLASAPGIRTMLRRRGTLFAPSAGGSLRRPTRPGMARSITTTRGSSRALIAIASSPLRAEPTRRSRAARRRARSSARRKPGWSSTTSTVTGLRAVRSDARRRARVVATSRRKGRSPGTKAGSGFDMTPRAPLGPVGPPLNWTMVLRLGGPAGASGGRRS